MLWLDNPRRKQGRCPKLYIPWDGPFFVTRILGNVVFEIRSKSKIVHVDKLAPVKGECDNSWVFKLPKKLQEAKPYEDLEGMSNLFETSTAPATSPVIVSTNPTCDVGTNTDVTMLVPDENVLLILPLRMFLSTLSKICRRPQYLASHILF